MNSNRLEYAENLQQLGASAASSGRPLLLMFTQQHCDFCHRLKDEILNPMMLNSDDRKRVLMRELSIDPGTLLTDFDGSNISGSDLFRRYKLVVTPTIMLFDKAGKALTEPLVGVNTIEMYSWYLDNAIDEARLKLRKTSKA